MESINSPELGTISTEITPRERMLRALRCQPADRVPGWMMRQAGRYLPQYHTVRNRYDFLELCKTPEAAAEVSIQPLDAVGSDAIVIFNDIMLPLEQAGAQVVFDEGGPLITNPVRKPEDLGGLSPHEVNHDEPIADTIRITRRRVGESIPILGFIGAPWTLTTYWVEGRLTRNHQAVGALRWGNPELLTELLDRTTKVATDYLRIQIEAGADAVQIFDTWGAMLSPGEYARFSAPYIRRIIEAIRPLGAPIIVYVNGAGPYLDQLAALGPDCISIDWRVDLAEARKIVGPSIALQGNLDPRALLAGPEATQRAIRELFEAFPPASGHVFNLGHGLLPTTPVESAQAAMKAVKQYGTY